MCRNIALTAILSVLGHTSLTASCVRMGPTLWSLILCIMGSATVVNPATTAELIEMPCGCEVGWTQGTCIRSGLGMLNSVFTCNRSSIVQNQILTEARSIPVDAHHAMSTESATRNCKRRLA